MVSGQPFNKKSHDTLCLLPQQHNDLASNLKLVEQYSLLRPDLSNLKRNLQHKSEKKDYFTWNGFRVEDCEFEIKSYQNSFLQKQNICNIYRIFFLKRYLHDHISKWPDRSQLPGRQTSSIYGMDVVFRLSTSLCWINIFLVGESRKSILPMMAGWLFNWHCSTNQKHQTDELVRSFHIISFGGMDGAWVN